MKGGGVLGKSPKVSVIAIGLLVGCFLAFSFPHTFFFSTPSSPSPSSSSSISSRRFTSSQVDQKVECEPSDELDSLKSEFQSLSSENSKLTTQLKELNSKLKRAAEIKDQAQTQYQLLGKSIKAGPFGTVKGLRTNPTVIPDLNLNPRLSNILEKIAPQKEVIVALANSNAKLMLKEWFTNIKRVGISNYLVVALDDDTLDFCNSNGVPVYKRGADEGVDLIAKTGSNHAISGLKFRVLREFLQMGYSVLLSDVDIVYLQNPFDHLYRDADVESMSDGHDNATAYGYNDVFDEPSMGWARYAHTMRIWAYNSGFFFIRPTVNSIELLDRVAKRLLSEKAWDQAAFNEELFLPSHPGYEGLYASKRSMDMYLFMNSKVLFKKVRKDKRMMETVKPVVVHVNYHPDKLERMKAVVKLYVEGKKDALNSFPDGSKW